MGLFFQIYNHFLKSAENRLGNNQLAPNYHGEWLLSNLVSTQDQQGICEMINLKALEGHLGHCTHSCNLGHSISSPWWKFTVKLNFAQCEYSIVDCKPLSSSMFFKYRRMLKIPTHKSTFFSFEMFCATLIEASFNL